LTGQQNSTILEVRPQSGRNRTAGGRRMFTSGTILLLQFEKASAEARIPLEIKVGYQPYLHQIEAWQRL
jgi:hypothetical protein